MDLYDVGRKQLVWRGDAVKTINLKKDPDKNYKNLQKVMAKLLRIIRLSPVSSARAEYHDRSGQMKLRTLKATVVGAVVLSIALLGACKSKQTQKPVVPVKVAAVELNAASSEARYSATIIPRTQVELAFKVGGYVDALRKVRGVDGKMRDIQEGDLISMGAVLARVRQSDYQVKFKEAESQASEARSGIDVSKAQYEEAVSGIASSKAQLIEAGLLT